MKDLPWTVTLPDGWVRAPDAVIPATKAVVEGVEVSRAETTVPCFNGPQGLRVLLERDSVHGRVFVHVSASRYGKPLPDRFVQVVEEIFNSGHTTRHTHAFSCTHWIIETLD
jgi:hypothetical protein